MFVSTLGEACQKRGWQVHAYCLMRNHFHFVIETPSANLVAGMSQMEARRRGKTQADHRQVRAVGAWGMINSERELLAVGKSAGGSHYGTERQERDQEKANRRVDEELWRGGWTEKELEQRPKGDRQKVETARTLRQQAGCSEWAIRNSRLPFCRLANPFQQS